MSILKLLIKDIDRTSPDMRLMEMVIIRKRLPSKESNGGKKVGLKISNEFGSVEWNIISSVGLDAYAMLPGNCSNRCLD
jgi:hypothetical protein